MRTRDATKPASGLLTLVVAAALLAACGADEHGAHFAGKTYGQGAADALPSGGGGGDDPVIDPAVLVPPTAPPTPTPAADPSPATPEPPVVVGDDVPADDGAKLSPDALIKRSELHSYFDQASAIGLKNGRGYKSLGLAATKVKANLTTAAGDGMILAQTFGDGVAKSLASQDITNSAGDANRAPDAPTASTVQTLFRVNSDACPGVFLCIEKLVSAPKTGDAMTVCFKDAATGAATTFPYGALPNYKPADFDGFYKDYGPYAVTAYAGADVDCADPKATPLAEEEIGVTVTKVDPAAYPLTLHTVDPLPAELAVAFDRHRVTGDLDAPYADETVALNHVTTYILNTTNAEILGLVVTKRQTIDFAAQAGGGILGGLAGALIGLDGVQVDLRFDFCRDLLKADAESHCAAGG